MVSAMSAKSPDPVRQQIGARVDQELITEVRVLALRQRRRFNELIEEALKDVLKKYREKLK
jgi:predicted HicB family RNase H-like nuclease